jgi:hypothetical protein
MASLNSPHLTAGCSSTTVECMSAQSVIADETGRDVMGDAATLGEEDFSDKHSLAAQPYVECFNSDIY